MMILPSYVRHPELPSWLPPPVKEWPKPFEPGYAIRVLQLGITYAATQGQDPFDNPSGHPDDYKRNLRGGPGPRVMCVANRQHVVPTSFNRSADRKPDRSRPIENYASFTEQLRINATRLYAWLEEHEALLHDVPSSKGRHTIINHDHPKLVFFCSEATNKAMDKGPGTKGKSVAQQAQLFRAVALGTARLDDESELIGWLTQRYETLDRFRDLLSSEKKSNFYHLARLHDIWSITPQKAFDLLCLYRSIPQVSAELDNYAPPAESSLTDLIMLKCLARAALIWDVWVELAGALRTLLKDAVDDLRYCERCDSHVDVSLASVLRPWIRCMSLWFEAITPVENIIDTTLAVQPAVRDFFPTAVDGATPGIKQVKAQWREDDLRYWRGFVDTFVTVCYTADWPVDQVQGDLTRVQIAETVAPRRLLEQRVDALVDRIHDNLGLQALWLLHRAGCVRALAWQPVWRRIAKMSWSKSLATINELFPMDPKGSSRRSLGLLERAATIRFRTGKSKDRS